MILVTSSRKPAPRVRRLCRDLAFAIEGEYRPRGKGGLSDPLFSRDTVVILGSRNHHLGLQVLFQGRAMADISFCAVAEEQRIAALRKGLRVGDPRILGILSPHLPAAPVQDAPPGSLVFDGIQGRTVRMVFCP